ncbi:MAG: hypothetical protein KC503_42445, partial [Myxococcales bacterium]|nr:hypothetical protein [Myxococcales bacterium]
PPAGEPPPKRGPASASSSARTVIRGNKGQLVVKSRPRARIFVDRKDTGRMSPTALELKPGFHMVTFHIKGQKFSYGVMVHRGRRVDLSRTLPVR